MTIKFFLLPFLLLLLACSATKEQKAIPLFEKVSELKIKNHVKLLFVENKVYDDFLGDFNYYSSFQVLDTTTISISTLKEKGWEQADKAVIDSLNNKYIALSMSRDNTIYYKLIEATLSYFCIIWYDPVAKELYFQENKS